MTEPSPVEPVLETVSRLGPGGARRALVVSAARGTVILGATLGGYAVLPISEASARGVVVVALAGAVGLAAVFTRQLGRVSRAPNPLLAAVEALLLVFGVFLSLGAFVYVALSTIDAGAFSEPLGKVAGLYFSVTVLSTVGFGDITPVSDAARIAVSVQMVVDMLLIGSAVKLLGFSAKHGVQARRRQAGPPGEEAPAAGAQTGGRPAHRQAERES